MSFGRKFAAGILTSILTVLLFALAVDIGFIRIAGTPGHIESILDKSGIYNSVVTGLLDEAKTINSTNGNVPLNDPIVRSAASSTLTPQYLRSNVNQALDSIYQWLNGDTSQPTFSVNLNQVKANFADKVAAGVKDRVASLPACPKTSSGTFDAFSTTCLPRGLSADQAAAQVRSSIVSGQGFLDNTNITANDLKANGSSQSVFTDQLKNLPKGYKNFKKSPFILAALGLLLGLAIVFIYESRLRGLRHIGFVVFGLGVFLILFALGLNEASSNKVTSKITLSNSVLQADLRTLVHDFVHALSGTYMVIGAIYAVLGALAVGAFYWFNKSRPAQAPEPKVAAAAPPAPEPAAAKPKAPARKIKVQ